MSSALDPVTGLPMVGVPDVVSQIPLGVQVVPWDDTKAVDRPQGGPAYPNDIINTFAWVTGENVSQPGTIHAGTMTNDRRLRVDTGSAGGVGAVTKGISNSGSSLSHGQNEMVFDVVQSPALIYSVSASIHFNTVPTARTFLEVTVSIDKSGGASNIKDVMSLSLCWLAASTGQFEAHGTVTFPGGLSVWHDFNPGDSISGYMFVQDVSTITWEASGLMSVTSG